MKQMAIVGILGLVAMNLVHAKETDKGISTVKSRFVVPPGFRVDLVSPNPRPGDPFSLVNMTFDNRGRLLVSKENGPVLLCTEPDQYGVFQSIKPYCDQVKNCQGMCWVDDTLLLVGTGPQGAGLYRVRDSQGHDKVDQIALLHQFVGGMGEHGPHAILHGPDGWLYQVVGNHAWAHPDKLADNSPLRRWPTGQKGTDVGQPGSTEDLLLPRLPDAGGHAVGIYAPGGTIWRMDHEGKHMGLVAASFRNEFDAAFSPTGELFTFDADMEWDVGLPWYRPVRVCHCPPGAEFGWRNGTGKLPAYDFDTLPAILDVGRGSPVGLEFYDHVAFPEKYHGAFFMADWSLGRIYSVHLEPAGATYQATLEQFCTGNPMNVTDLAVGPDGALYFTMGGRGSPGGIGRITSEGATAARPASTPPTVEDALQIPQPLSAWARERISRIASSSKDWDSQVLKIAQDPAKPIALRVRALNHLAQPPSQQGKHFTAEIIALASDKDPAIRAQAVWLLGVNECQEGRDTLLRASNDENLLVRRRAFEAMIRAGIDPPLEAIWPLLAHQDRFLATAARLVLQRQDPKIWITRLWNEPNDHIALQGIVALCKNAQAAPYAGPIFERLSKVAPGTDVSVLLDSVRTMQLVLIYTKDRPANVKALVERYDALFPHADWRVNRELAILLAYCRKENLTDKPVHAQLLQALEASKGDKEQQIHYYFCLRVLHEGWTPQQKSELLAWYDSTKTWTGGHSFTPYLENILGDARDIFTAEDVAQIVARGTELPQAAAALLHMTSPQKLPAPDALADLYQRILKAKPPVPHGTELAKAVIDALGRSPSLMVQQALRTIGAQDPARRNEVARSLARFPVPENWPFLVQTLGTADSLVRFEIIKALEKIAITPKADDPRPFRALLLTAGKMDVKNRWQIVLLLRHWTGNKQFGADEGDWEAELTAWSRWFAQTFPKEPPLPNLATGPQLVSKYKYDELLPFLEKDPQGRKGDSSRGRLVFEKAQCIKCHKFGTIGEGVGPDLSEVSKRFNRPYILESILFPSKVISDQYRSTVVVTKSGLQITGLAAPLGDTVTLLQSDATRVTVKKEDIAQQYASLVSTMPEKLLDPLNKQEIADLFAFLESHPH